MKYEFFKETLVSKYIKYLLSKTPLPQYSYIKDNQYMIKDCTYVYKNRLLKCTHSGIFIGLKGGQEDFEYLNVSDDLKVIDPFNVDGLPNKDNQNIVQDYEGLYGPQNPIGWMTVNIDGMNKVLPLSVTDDLTSLTIYEEARFNIIGLIREGIIQPNITQVYSSSEGGYGTETHRVLGEYLRYLKHIKNVDLMSLYNCFNYTVVRNIVLNSESEDFAYQAQNELNKVVLIPIKFDQTYTIAIDSNFKVSMCPIFFKDGILLRDITKENYLHKNFIDSLKIYGDVNVFQNHNTLQFHSPITYKVPNYFAEYKVHEKYLYLAIQIPHNNTSSIVVLEGDYTNNTSRIISDVSVLSRPGVTFERYSNALTGNVSLLKYNDGKQHPFADTLIEYICDNTIDPREQYTENVERIVSLLGDFMYGYEGQWTDYLRYTIYNRLQDYNEKKGIIQENILGYVDSTTENIINKGDIKHVS